MAFPEAVLWDMDGTLVNTEPAWRKVEEQTVNALGGTFSLTAVEDLIGLSLPLCARFMQERMGVKASVPEIVDQLDKRMQRELRDNDAEWCAGALEAIEIFAGLGIPMALVTSSPYAMTSAVLEKLPQGTFAGAITGDRVENSKPHPEPYLLGAELTGADISRTLIFEDSVIGLTAAVASGGVAVAIPNQIPIPASTEYSRLSSLTQLDELVLERLGRREIVDLV